MKYTSNINNSVYQISNRKNKSKSTGKIQIDGQTKRSTSRFKNTSSQKVLKHSEEPTIGRNENKYHLPQLDSRSSI